MKNIKQFPRNKITLDELQKAYQIDEYSQLVEKVTRLNEAVI